MSIEIYLIIVLVIIFLVAFFIGILSAEEGRPTDIEWVLSISGMFASGTSDTSQNVDDIVGQAIERKYERLG